MTIAIITFPGSNCDQDARYALQDELGASVRMVWHTETSLSGVEAVIVPGGFSYGDYLRSGALAAHSPVMGSVKRFAAAGGPVLGICNGFQILTEAGLLPGQLARNPGLTFQCRDVHLRVESSRAPFSSRAVVGEVLRLPIAHNEGSYFVDAVTLERLEAEGRVLLRYCDPTGAVTPEANYNGSLNNIAGIINESGNVVGMMPHPERAVSALLGSVDGIKVLGSLVDALKVAA